MKNKIKLNLEDVVITPYKRKTKLVRHLWIKRDGVWHRMRASDFEEIWELFQIRQRSGNYGR